MPTGNPENRPDSRLARRFVLAAALLGLAGLPVAAMPQPQAPGAAPGAARIWFYRVFFPDDSATMAAVAINGAPAGYLEWGTSLYRDVTPGTYSITVSSFGDNGGPQQQTVALKPGEQVFVEVVSDPTWEGFKQYRRPTYSLRLVTPQLAALQLPQTRWLGGS